MPNDLPDWQRQAYTRLLLGQISVAPNTTSPVTNFVLPVGCLAVAFQANTQPSPPNNVTIIGHVTGNVYFNGSPGSLFTSRFIDPQIDSSIDVTITSPMALGSSVTFMAVEVPENVFVRNSTGEAIPVQPAAGQAPFNVRIQDWTGVTLGPSVVVEPSGNHAIAVAEHDPQLWQSPNNAPVSLDDVIAGGATVVKLGGTANQIIRLFGFLAATGGAVIALQDTAANEIGSLAAGANAGVNLAGAPLSVGIGFQLKNLGGVNATINGTFSYSKG